MRSPLSWERRLADVAAGGRPEVDAAVAAARAAFPAWAALGPEGRHPDPDPLRGRGGRGGARPGDRRDGRQRVAAGGDAPARPAARCQQPPLLRRLRRRAPGRAAAHAARRRAQHASATTRPAWSPCPRPWNAPFMLATWRVGPALAAGNTVVLKPPEWAPLTCSMLGDLAAEAGLPPGVLNVVHGTGAEAGAPLTGHPDVDRVAFTGSPATAPHRLPRRRRPAHARLVRARRQVALRRARRRRPRRGRGDRRLPVRQLRPGVPRRDAAARPALGPRRRSWSASARRSTRSGSATRASPGRPTARSSTPSRSSA